MGKGLKYGEFEFPNSGVTYVRGYARGGKVSQAKVSKVMHEFGAGELHSGSKKGPVVQNRKQAIAIGMSEGRKAAAGKYAGGGMVHPDAKQDKAMIKKAVGMHDTQLHGGKHTNLSKLKTGGMVGTYAKGGMTKGGMTSANAQKPAAVMKPRAKSMKPMDKGNMQGALGAMSSPMMKVGGMVKKPSMNLSPKSRADSPPKSINVKARMSLGSAGSPENLACGGRVRRAK